jgi:ABC-2 type transport system permease protein
MIAFRYAQLCWIQSRLAMAQAVQYRAELSIALVADVCWVGQSIVPLLIAFQLRPTLGGWTLGEALIVLGWFTLLQAPLGGIIYPSLGALLNHVREGTFDFVLLKPVHTQLLVFTGRLEPARFVNIPAAVAIFVWAYRVLGRRPTVTSIAHGVLAAVTAFALLYAIWLLAASASFVVTRLDDFPRLFSAAFDAARWPVDVFRGTVRLLFVFIFPAALMTTFPAQALLGTLTLTKTLASLACVLVLVLFARRIWRAAICEYTSSGG